MDDQILRGDGPEEGVADKSGTASTTSGDHVLQDTVASLSMHFPDCIRLLCFPDEIIDLIRATILASWPQGIHHEKDQARSLEFRLKGWPWGVEDVPAKRLLCKLLEVLYNHGWVMLATTALSRNPTVLDQLFFEYQTPTPPLRNWMSITFALWDRVRIADAPGDILHAMVASLGSEKQTHGPYKLSGTYEFKLRGNLWRGGPKDHTAASLITMTLLQTLKRNGWKIYANIDAKLQARDKGMLRQPDAWICCRDAEWDPAASIDFQ